MAKKKDEPKAGRPRMYEDAAAKMRAFRAKAAYPGKRYDVYLGKEANIAVIVQVKKTGLPASTVIDAMVRCANSVPPRELAKWLPATK